MKGAPLFPRLHVSDAEKGGPRPPPRNKMALYEQLSVATPRFTNSGSLPHKPSSSQGGGCERYAVSQFYTCPPPTASSTEKVQSCSPNTPLAGDVNFSSVNASEPFALTAECSSLPPHFFSKLKYSGRKKLDNEEVDNVVSGSVDSNLTPTSSIYQHNNVMKRLPCSIDPGCLTVLPRNGLSKTAAAMCSSPTQLNRASNLQLKGSNSKKLTLGSDSKDLTTENHVKSQRLCIDNLEVKMTSARNLTSQLLLGQKSKTDENSKSAVSCLGQDCQSNPVNDLENMCDMDVQLQQARSSGLQQESVGCSDGVPTEPNKRVEENLLSVRSESCSSTSIRYDCRSPKEIDKKNGGCDDEACMPFETDDVDRNDDTSEASLVQSVSGVEITSDDVVDIIGQQHFWKARRVILNQQRAFATQVFELHRLIEVQRLFAGLPNLLDENTDVRKPSRKPPNECILKAQIVKGKNDSQKQNQSSERADENSEENHRSNLQVAKGITKELAEYSSFLPPQSNCSSFSRNTPPALLPANNNAGPWSLHLPPGNQWLVPVMSPSEGLIYKPYAGPFPPNAGFMAQIYGGCGPNSTTSLECRFLNSSFGTHATLPQELNVHPAVHTFPSPTTFPSYCMPLPNQVNSTSAYNLTALPGTAILGQAEQFQCQSNSSNHGNQASSSCLGKFQAYKGSERHSSLGSHHSTNTQELGANQVSEGRTALPLFPMDSPIVKPLQNRSQQKTLIKVVPHNPISATASAARIFQSIQAERRQCDTS
ncbi:hypothetical protein Sjap_019495 [Stephania japonica]|uniref:Uncharacterized protein n=1 Tax=Stephania japonica TaxID=461633 RepID=A0AAP0HZE4_9MAGN